ncbi:hypothetical protein ABW19_dt0204436 [Dactylella cylindrospora]|nr:hypothetical protein ABW19_dt0204436 [Dactylella cylindrospora]
MNHHLLLPSLRIAISTSARHYPRLSILSSVLLPFTPTRYRYYATMTSEEPTVPAPTATPAVHAPAEHPATSSHKYGKVVLAPMVRTGELPTRLLALKYGADLVWGPETIDKALIGCERVENKRVGCVDYVKGARLVYRTYPDKEKSRLVFQIGSASPELAAEAAKVIAQDVSGIDLNAGCPKHFSVHAGMGAGLLKNPTNLIAILKSLISTVGLSTPYGLPVSVKIRLLDSIEETHALISDLCKTGISKLTLHCRRISMRPRERAIRDALAGAAKICKDAGVPFFVNGDVENWDMAQELIKQYGIDGGAMIAISAESNPSVFIPQYKGGPKNWKDVMTEYLETAMEVENSFSNTKFCILHLVPGKEPEYQSLSRCKTYKEICDIVGVECTVPEEKDVGTTKTQKQKAVEEREAQAKREKEERLAKRVEMLKRKREDEEKQRNEASKKTKTEVGGESGKSGVAQLTAMAATAATAESVDVGVAV